MSASLNGKMAYLAIYKGRVLSPGELSELDQQLPIKQPNLPLVVSITSPSQGISVNSQVTVSASVDKAVQRVDFTLGTQTISAAVAPFQATLNLTSLAEGPATITATAVGFDSTTASAFLNIVVDHTNPPAPDPTKIFAEPPVGNVSRVHGLAGAVTPSITVEVTDLTNGLQELTTAAADGSFTVGILATAGDSVSVVAIDRAENRSPASVITVRAVDSPFARLMMPGRFLVATNCTAPRPGIRLRCRATGGRGRLFARAGSVGPNILPGAPGRLRDDLATAETISSSVTRDTSGNGTGFLSSSFPTGTQ
jgi:hypothetical protein